MANSKRTPVSYRPFRADPLIAEGLLPVSREGGDLERRLSQVLAGAADRLGQRADRQAAAEGARAQERAALAAPPQRLAQAGTAAPQAPAGASRAQVAAPAQIRDVIVQAAQRNGVDPAAMLKIAELESTFNPRAQNDRSSAGGLFQFTDQTARDYNLTDRFDPVQASDAAARLARNNAATLRKVLGRDPTIGELYLAHQQGAGGASKLLARPNARAVDVVGRDEVLLNGGTEDMTAGEFANRWMARAGGASSIASAQTVTIAEPGAAPGQAAGWRPSGADTIRGRAGDAAGARVYLQQLQGVMLADQEAVYHAYKDDPVRLEAALGELKQAHLREQVFPEIAADYAVAYDRQAQGLVRDARRAAETRAREDMDQSSLLELRQLEETRSRLLARIDPAAPDAADRLYQAQAAIDGQIDARVAQGLMTPVQAEEAKSRSRRVTLTGFYERQAEGKTADEVAAMRAEIRRDYAAGEIDGLDAAGFDALDQALAVRQRQLKEQATKLTAEGRVLKAQAKRLIGDDIASIETTGRPVDLAANGFDPATLETLMTPEELQDWRLKREEAGQVYEATAGMEVMPADEIEARLLEIQPQAGSAGYAEQERVQAKAERKARLLLRQRASDPAAAVEDAFPEIRAQREAADMLDPASAQGVITARLQAQDALDIPEHARQPLTREEAKALAGPVSGVSDPVAQVTAMQQLVADVQARFGNSAPDVLRQVLETRGVDRDLASYGANLLTKLNAGQRPTGVEQRQGAVLNETGAAARAMEPPALTAPGRPNVAAQLGAMAGASRPPMPEPPYQAIQLLISQPGLAADFDRKYGPGSAARILADRREDPSMRRVEGGIEFVDETGEGFIPDGEVINGR